MIKNIIFDFGDIFINLDKPATAKEFLKLGIAEFTPEMYAVYHKYEKGLMSTEEYIAFYKHKFPALKTYELINAWNAILLDFPMYRLAFLKELSASKKYRLFLLSNTNDLHIEWVKKTWGMELYNAFKSCFEGFYLSHEIHYRKPDSSIYEYVLNENKLKAAETLFIDDLQENTDGAKALGIAVWNLIPGKEDVIDLLTIKEL